MIWNVADLMEAIADRVPEREAIVVDGGPVFSWAEMDERASRLANWLLESGCAPGEHLAIYCANGNEYLEAMYASFKARMVPINVNWRYRPHEIEYLFDDADAVACVVDPQFASVLDSVRGNLPKLHAVVETGGPYEKALAAALSERPLAGERSGEDRYFIYTGGTTGYPKGVMWRQDDIVLSVWGSTVGIDPAQGPEQIPDKAELGRTRYFGIPPFMHGTSHWGAFGAFLAASTVLCRRETHLDPAATWRFAADAGANVISIVGDAFGGPLLRELEEAEAKGEPYDLEKMRVVISSGAVFSEALKDGWARMLPRVVIADTLGSSESGVEAVAPWRKEVRTTRFMTNSETLVVDVEEGFKPVEAGSGKVGMVVRTGHIPLGYYKDDEKTARTFPTVDGVRYVVTGDHATVDTDGTVVLLGRGSNCINTGGEKVYPEEVENILKAHPDVLDALVVGLPDERFGNAVTAVASVRAGALPTLEEVRSFVSEELAGYKAPRHLVLVEKVPRAPSGKPDYPAAKAAALEQLGMATG